MTENMIVIPVPTPSVVHTLIPIDFVPPVLQSKVTPSPGYVEAYNDNLLHDGVPEYWVDPDV